jgi:hypothetical protein
MGVWGAGCGGSTEESTAVDPAPPPNDGGYDVKDARTEDIFMSDCVPPDAGKQDIWVVDDVPADTGVDVQDTGADVQDTGADVQQADPPPQDSGVEDVTPFDNWADPVPPDASEAMIGIDRFHDTSPRRAVRTNDLPLFHPPQVKIQAVREGAQVVATLRGHGPGMSTRWQSDGEIDGDGSHVLWTPLSGDDQLRVAVRSTGGVAVVSIRAADLS